MNPLPRMKISPPDIGPLLCARRFYADGRVADQRRDA
jgi:hypothetical protein